jgi:hypothetical protein
MDSSEDSHLLPCMMRQTQAHLINRKCPSGPASERQTWLSEVDAARCMARFEDVGYTDAILDEPDPHLVSPVNTEGSICFRSQRCRRSGVIEHIKCSIPQNWKNWNPKCVPLCLWPRLLSIAVSFSVR